MRTIRGLGDLVAILIQSALLLPNVATGSSLFSGAEEAVIGTAAVTEACLSALKGDIGCDSALLQRISFASHPDGTIAKHDPKIKNSMLIDQQFLRRKT